MKTACVFSIDDAYVMPFKVLFHSLEATKSIPASTSIFILHSQSLRTGSIRDLELFLDRYGRKASFLDASCLIPSDLPIRPGDHVSPATFYRLFITELLPIEIDQAVYLDADMLALSSISTLFEEQVQGLVAAVDHCSPENELRLWGDRGGTYFQAGVLVIPMHTWRKKALLQRFLEVMNSEQNRIQWWDQDVLNLALHDNWQRLPIWLNVCEAVHGSFPYAMVENHAALIHYSGSNKPWNSFNPSPFTVHWDKGYKASFGQSFDRAALAPPSPPLRTRIKHAVRRFIFDWI